VKAVRLQVGRLPDGDKGIDHLREIFHPKANDGGMVATPCGEQEQETYGDIADKC